uniref:Uncharacterized protein n=1 Tax=Vespula pensylvanica TaxID=30213 RepID=A0A834U870_VESPE|nr:hypothetical protein H0235_010934 [Vespula pensylvanica]
MLGDGDEVNDRPRLEVRGVQCMKPAVIATLLQSNLQGELRLLHTRGRPRAESGSKFESLWPKRKLRPTYFAFEGPCDVFVTSRC